MSVSMLGSQNLFQRTAFAPLLSDLGFRCLDIGSRFGFDPDLEPIAFAVNAFGFEPHPEECARLMAASAGDPSPWRSVRYLPLALSGTGGKRTLHVPTNTASASLLEHDPSIGRAFRKEAMFTIEKRFELDTVTLDEAVAACGIDAPDYLKLDIEGAELEVLESGPMSLAGALAIKTEVSFMHFRRAQPLASDIDTFLRKQGFVLMDFTGSMRWRRSESSAHPQVCSGEIPYSRGQLAHGDFLYFRDPDTLDAGEGEPATTRLLKLACLAMTWGFFDHASDLFALPGPARVLDERYGIRRADALRDASAEFGGGVWAAALAHHLRSIVPFLRSVGPVLRSRMRSRPRSGSAS